MKKIFTDKTRTELGKLGNYLLCAAPVVGDLNAYRLLRKYDKSPVPLFSTGLPTFIKNFSLYLMATPPKLHIPALAVYTFFSVVEAMILSSDYYYVKSKNLNYQNA